MPKDSQEYLERKKFTQKLLTIYGRKPALEAVTTPNTKVYRVHLASTNKPASIISEIVAAAETKGAEILYHDKSALSRISKNSRQDQGVAVDLLLEGFNSLEDFIQSPPQEKFELLALENITNPQNLGMIIRSVCASPTYGILLPEKGCAKLDSLVIKASAGTIFKANIIRCQSLLKGLSQLKSTGAQIAGLDAKASTTLKDFQPKQSVVYILGNESKGITQDIQNICNTTLRIPMERGVESLNVAVTAGLLAFRSSF